MSPRRPPRQVPGTEVEANPYEGRPVVMLVGGPRDGWCYFEADLLAQVRAAERLGVPPLPYTPTGTFEVHPGLSHDKSVPAGWSCVAWQFSPRAGAAVTEYFEDLRRSA